MAKTSKIVKKTVKVTKKSQSSSIITSSSTKSTILSTLLLTTDEILSPLTKKPMKLTPFQKMVYDLCSQIPKGYVSTYSEIALAMKNPSAVRAVGTALSKNPFAPTIPCHRVVTSSRTMGGFCGFTSGPEIERKIQMLKEESVEFEENGKVHLKCIYKFPRE